MDPRFDDTGCFLVAKKNQEEVTLQRLPPEQQERFTGGSDVKEWNSMLDHVAVEVVLAAIAHQVRREHPGRIMGCRFVRDFRRTDEEQPGLTVWIEGVL